MTTGADRGPREVNYEDQPNAARAYDYFLGGSSNFAADRAFAEQVLQIAPSVPAVTRLNRSFLRRVVHYYLDQGVTQFLDLGSGIPTAGNVHEITERRTPDSRVVYVDYEPVAYAHASSLLADDAKAAIIHADLRDPASVLDHPDTRALLDFDRPVGLLLVGVLLFIGDEDRPADLISAYAERLAPGSLVAMSHISTDRADDELQAEVGRLVQAYESANEHVFVRSRDEMLPWFDGMSLVDPGFVLLPDWRPDNDDERNSPARLLGYGGVGRIG
ncbi:MAG TPA: SAM-dependent methyltransferase [Actinocatenispora sp.]